MATVARLRLFTFAQRAVSPRRAAALKAFGEADDRLGGAIAALEQAGHQLGYDIVMGGGGIGIDGRPSVLNAESLRYRRWMHIVLETERLQLRKIRESDLDDLVALDSDPQVMKYLNGGAPTPRSEYLGPDGILARMMRWPEPKIGFFSAVVDGVFIGWFHLRPSVFEPEILELGYRLSRPHWGKGYATEGGRALCRLAFDELDQETVDGCTMPDNLASIAVLKKCGMSYVGDAVHPRVPSVVSRFVVSRMPGTQDSLS